MDTSSTRAYYARMSLRKTQTMGAVTDKPAKPVKEKDIHIRARPGDRKRFSAAIAKAHADDLSSWLRSIAHAECDRLKIPR